MAAAHEVKRADIRAYVGATGSGKGVGINAHLDAIKSRRFVAVDPLREYGGRGLVVTSAAQVIAALKKPTFSVIWQPPDDADYAGAEFKADFERVCKAVFLVGNLDFLVEELELFTRPTWAPVAWKNCTKRGRHQRLRIIAATQRPADADKAFWSSCTYIRCHALRETEDGQRMARVLKVPYEQIDSLRTIAVSATETRITYYEKDFSAGTGGEKTVTLRRR